MPNKGKSRKSKSINKSKTENKNKNSDEEGPIYEKLYNMHKDKERKLKTLSIEKEKQLRMIYTFTPQIGNSREEKIPMEKSEFFERNKR